MSYRFEDHQADDDPTMPCPECGRAVYDDTEQCPKCGYYLTRADRMGRSRMSRSARRRWTVVIVALVVLSMLLPMLAGVAAVLR